MKLVKRILNHKLFSYHIDGYMSRSGICISRNFSILRGFIMLGAHIRVDVSGEWYTAIKRME